MRSRGTQGESEQKEKESERGGKQVEVWRSFGSESPFSTCPVAKKSFSRGEKLSVKSGRSGRRMG